ncbi:hypothetical protein ALC56_14387, partial [Trachymyrmex septentrionalis]
TGHGTVRTRGVQRSIDRAQRSTHGAPDGTWRARRRNA